MGDRDRKRGADGHDDQYHRKKPRHDGHPYHTPHAKPFSGFKPVVKINPDLPPPPKIHDQFAERVFTHISSVPSSNKTPSSSSYDDLEFIGDAYIEVVASNLIYQRFSSLPTGRKSQLREALVKNETLARFTEGYGWDKQIKNAKLLQRESAQAWLKIRGDVFEAYVAAVVLSHDSYTDGLRTIEPWLHALWAPTIDSLAASNPTAPSTQHKVELAKKIAGPRVKINYTDEKAPIIHKGQGVETYFIGAYLTGWGWDNQFLGSGKGLSRTAAGQEAAAAALANTSLIDEIVAKKASILNKAKEEQDNEP